jgi:hypothetical protein
MRRIEFRAQVVLPWHRSVPTDEEHALVKLLIANDYADRLDCKCISNVVIRTYRSMPIVAWELCRMEP